MNNYNKDLIFYRLDTSKLNEDAVKKLLISDMKIRYKFGKYLSKPHDYMFTDRTEQCLNAFLTSNQKAQQATLCFIWSSLAQGVLPREIIFEIAKLIWKSRKSPYFWLN